jgi:hypothetical protein
LRAPVCMTGARSGELSSRNCCTFLNDCNMLPRAVFKREEERNEKMAGECASGGCIRANGNAARTALRCIAAQARSTRAMRCYCMENVTAKKPAR